VFCGHGKNNGDSVKRYLLLFTLLLSATTIATSVREQEGNIFYVGDDGASRQLTSTHANTDPLLTPDGQKVVYLKNPPNKPLTEDEQKYELWELWLSDISGKDAHRILEARPDDDPEKNLSYFNSLTFSPDSKQLYILTKAWATSNALHVLDLARGKEHFITGTDDVLVISKGRYANHLVVMKHKYFKQGGSYDYYRLITLQGKEIKKSGRRRQAAG
jgi:hypothetical protein